MCVVNTAEEWSGGNMMRWLYSPLMYRGTLLPIVAGLEEMSPKPEKVTCALAPNENTARAQRRMKFFMRT